jgi:starch synthase (maltosyl-transferring)
MADARRRADPPARPVDNAPDLDAMAAPGGDARSPEACLALRAIIEKVRPQVDGGRFPAKGIVGDPIAVRADIYADGHDVLVAVLRDRPVSSAGSASPSWRETRMLEVAPFSDDWSGSFTCSSIGWHEFDVTAWVDPFETWRRGLRAKFEAGQDPGLELHEGAALVREASSRAAQIGQGAADAEWLEARADALCRSTPVVDRVSIALEGQLAARMFEYAGRGHASRSRTLRIWVDRVRAVFGAWYEMFPRSQGPDPARSATFAEAAGRLPAVAALGFDVLYLPPIHPIGHSFRKGRNNSLTAAPDDPGSPWAIGSESGGHTAVEPRLGTIDDFDGFRQAAERAGLEVALDLAFQCSPDHPWVREHPEWFRHRPDGTIKYAENPPKKYQDIYPLDLACQDWRALWQALLDVVLFWVGHGVRIFRVDNPHTKTFGFWEWLITRVHGGAPDVIFLAEAFTRPRLMQYLAKAGFTQSYTYFTWRNTKPELETYLTELTTNGSQDYFRPNLFANTPDILNEYLQSGGRPAFEARLLLAATLSASYGIYSGFELCENRPARPGSEEYLDSEKYQIRHRDWDRPGNINALIATVNRIRSEHRALQRNGTLRFCETDNPQLIAFSKTAPGAFDAILVVVNLDPHFMQHGHVRAPIELIGAGELEPFTARDLLTGTEYVWSGAWNYVRFDPGTNQGHILQLEKRDKAHTDNSQLTIHNSQL